jgi:hypothetical protein
MISKKAILFLIIVVSVRATFGGNDILFAQGYKSDSPAEKGNFKWPDGKQVAVSITFDDARISQTERGIPLLDNYGVRGTFYISPGNVVKHLEKWKMAVAAGHEIGNHLIYHPCSVNFEWSRSHALENYSLDQMKAELDSANRFIMTLLGVECVSFGYPCGQTYIGSGASTQSYVPLIASMFETGRGWLGETPNDPLFCNMSQITGIEIDGKSFAQVLSIIESARAGGKWVVFAGHEMSDGGAQTTLLSTLGELCQYAADPANGIWLDNVHNIASYIIKKRAENSTTPGEPKLEKGLF